MPIGRYENPVIGRLRQDRRGIDHAIAQIAALQAGQVHRDQLLSLGLGAGAIDHRLATGRLHRTRWSVYGVGHPRDDLLARWHAAVLTSGDGAALSHRAGAAHLGILPIGSAPIEITVPRQRRQRAGIRQVWRDLPADEVTIEDGIPVTHAVRILFDLAGIVPSRQFRRAVKEVDVRRLYCHLSLADLLDRHPRPAGASVIRAVIEERAEPAGVVPSDGEEMLAALVREMKWPMPAHRFGIALAEGWVEVDFAWPDLRVAVEVDSSFHEAHDAYENDHARDGDLLAEGWLVFRVTWRQLHADPARVRRRLERLLARAEATRSLRGRREARTS